MRVLVVNCLDAGYGSTYRARELGRALRDLGHDVEYAEPNVSGALRGLPRVTTVAQPASPLGFARGTLVRAALAGRGRYDALYLQKFLPLGAPAQLAAAVRGRRVIVDWDDRDAAFQRGRARRAVVEACERVLPRMADHITTHNEALAAHARRRSGRPVTLVPQVVDLERFDPARLDRAAERRRRGLEDQLVVGHLCTLTEGGARDLDRVVRTAAALLDAEPRARFVLIGGGALEGAARAMLEAAGIADRSRITGLVAQDEVPAWLTCLDIGLLHMRADEGSAMRVSLKLLESLALGVPVAGNACGPSQEAFARFGIDAGDGLERLPRPVAAAVIDRARGGGDNRGAAARAWLLANHGRPAIRKALAAVFGATQGDS